MVYYKAEKNGMYNLSLNNINTKIEWNMRLINDEIGKHNLENGIEIVSTTVIPKASNINIYKTNYTYNGRVLRPSVTVKDSKGKVKFKGYYYGTVSKSYTITPKGTSISGLTPLKKGMRVKWRKQSVQSTGYEIQIATNSKFSAGVKNMFFLITQYYLIR